mgnify:CR=1 FL=1
MYLPCISIDLPRSPLYLPYLPRVTASCASISAPSSRWSSVPLLPTCLGSGLGFGFGFVFGFVFGFGFG